MATPLPQPPYGTPFIDPRTSAPHILWQNYLNALALAFDVNAAPKDAKYWVSTSNADLTDETNLGALATGYLKLTTAVGVGTPSTVASIPGADVSGAALTKTNDTNVTLTLGGTPATALLKAASLTLGWSGTLGLARGGTNADLSATGGTSQVLKQTTVGGAVTVAQLSATDVANVPLPLFDHFADVSNGTTVETDLYSDTLAAGRLSANGQKVLAQYGGTFVGDATSTQRLRAYFGGTLIADTGALGIGATTASWNLAVSIIRESASIVRCAVAISTSFATFAASATYTKVTGLTLANTQALKITGTAAGATGASNQITASEGWGQFAPAA